jgi:hypothetical protein
MNREFDTVVSQLPFLLYTLTQQSTTAVGAAMTISIRKGERWCRGQGPGGGRAEQRRGG